MTSRGYPTQFQEGARRLDAGGRPNPICIPMLAKALEQVAEWTPERVALYCRPLTDRIAGEIVAALAAQTLAPGVDWLFH